MNNLAIIRMAEDVEILTEQLRAELVFPRYSILEAREYHLASTVRYMRETIKILRATNAALARRSKHTL